MGEARSDAKTSQPERDDAALAEAEAATAATDPGEGDVSPEAEAPTPAEQKTPGGEATPTTKAAPEPAGPATTRTVDPQSKPGPWMRPEDRAKPMQGLDRSVWSDFWVRLGVIVVVLLIFFPGLGSFGLWDPWEVHYGEVGQQMIERGDWISPWWGSHWHRPGDGAEGAYFFSKPVLLLWMMGMGMQVFGFGALGARFGTALIASLGVIAVYMMGNRVWGKRTGALMAGTLLTSPFYFFLGRQAQTDMPYVGTMTVALAFFMMGVFGEDRHKKVDKLFVIALSAFTLLITIPQLVTITIGQLDPVNYENHWYFWELMTKGLVQLAIYVAMIGTVAYSSYKSEQKTRGQYYLYVFYIFIALATMAKGILGFALPGAIIFVYLVVSREWGLLSRVELFRGVLITLFVGMPWYGAVMARHNGVNGAFWQRFIIHDHFNRLTAGVHQIDNGSFEHFIKWLGYGLFPWGSFVPAIVARAIAPAKEERTDQSRAKLFLFLWFVIAFSLFTLASTKFHHYIFPAVPPLALLAALLLDELLDGRFTFKAYWPLYVAAGVLFVVVGFDLITDTQHLKNMFTYKYDRRWDHDTWDPKLFPMLRYIFAAYALGLLALAFPKRRKVVAAGVAFMTATGLTFAAWSLNFYMPTISSTFSQEDLWNTYYDTCTRIDGPRGAHPMKRYCLEPAISYKLNWRGETFFTQNEIIPIRNDDEWDYFIEDNGGACFYAIMERGRLPSFRSALPAEQRDSVHEAHADNIKFTLVRVNCGDDATEDISTEGDSDAR